MSATRVTTGFMFVLFLVRASSAGAFSGGVSGSSGKSKNSDCTGCHGAGMTAPPTVTIDGPHMLIAGQTASYTLAIDGTTGMVGGAFDIAAGDGTLSPADANSQLMTGELTHTSNFPRGKSIKVSFSFTAPAARGPVTLFAAGMATDAKGTPDGDASVTTTLVITVGDPPDLAGVDQAGLDLSQPPDLAPPVDLAQADQAVAKKVFHDEPRWDCGCRLGARRTVNPNLSLAVNPNRDLRDAEPKEASTRVGAMGLCFAALVWRRKRKR